MGSSGACEFDTDDEAEFVSPGVFPSCTGAEKVSSADPEDDVLPVWFAGSVEGSSGTGGGSNWERSGLADVGVGETGSVVTVGDSPGLRAIGSGPPASPESIAITANVAAAAASRPIAASTTPPFGGQFRAGSARWRSLVVGERIRRHSRAASSRDSTSSFARISRTWYFAPSSEMPSASAISPFVFPAAMSSSTSCWRGLRSCL